MGTWTRDELETAFRRYQQRAETAARTGDWTPWAAQFTDDATYVEHHYGTFHGRDEIRAWITETMSTFPGNLMPEFPTGWHVVDDEKGWVIFQAWNRMADPGDGTVHEAYNVTILKYAGDDQWSYEEDIYNPASFATMLAGWEAARRQSRERGGQG